MINDIVFHGLELSASDSCCEFQALADLILGTAIDHELCQIGGNIANTHQDINPMMAEYVRTEQELSNHDKKGMVS